MSKVRSAMIGCGGMARHHLKNILKQQDTTRIVALCDPNPAALELSTEMFVEAGLEAPPTWQSLETMLIDIGDELDATFIITPHAFHHDQTIACMESGLDVLLEKPMVVNAEQAINLIEIRNNTKQLLVVAFQGSLSPQVRTASAMLRAGELGDILNINGVVLQNWRIFTDNTWRQMPLLSGGGFMFDTGAHVLNTVADLAGEEFEEVAAWFDMRGKQIDILAAAMGRLKSGALVTFNACGDTNVNTCWSDIRVFCTDGILQTTMWGDFLNLQRPSDEALQAVEVQSSLGVWEQFLAVRNGDMENPSPPEVGLRMAKLWDALQESAANGGRQVKVRM